MNDADDMALDNMVAIGRMIGTRKNTQPGLGPTSSVPVRIATPTLAATPVAKRASERPGSYSVINPR